MSSKSDRVFRGVSSLGNSITGALENRRQREHETQLQQMRNENRDPTMDALRQYLMREGAQQRDEAAQRLETNAIQQEAGRLGLADVRKQTDALSNISAMLADPKAVDQGRIATELRNLVETGVATDADVNRQIPITARTLVNKVGTFFGAGNIVDPYSEEHLKGLRDYVQGRQGHLNKKIETSRQELLQRAPQLAPNLQRKGALPKVIESLGASPQSLIQEHNQPAPKFDRKAALEAARKRLRGN